MYAVVEIGGKQMRVEPGQVFEVDRVAGDPGSEVTLGRVLLLVDGDAVTCGTPEVAGAAVTATVVALPRTRKILVGKFRSKKHYRRKVGHRQPLSRLRVERITTGQEAQHGA